VIGPQIIAKAVCNPLIHVVLKVAWDMVFAFVTLEF